MKKFIKLSRHIRDCWNWNPKWWIRARIAWHLERKLYAPEDL